MAIFALEKFHFSIDVESEAIEAARGVVQREGLFCSARWDREESTVELVEAGYEHFGSDHVVQADLTDEEGDGDGTEGLKLGKR